MQGGATQADAAQCKHCGDSSKRSLDIVEEHAPIMLCIIGVRCRCPCAAGTLWAHRACDQASACEASSRREEESMRDIVDDEQRRDCPQPLCAQRVPAAQGRLLRTPIMQSIIGACSSTMSKLRLDGSPQCLHCAASACVAPPCICPSGARNAACCTFTTGC